MPNAPIHSKPNTIGIPDYGLARIQLARASLAGDNSLRQVLREVSEVSAAILGVNRVGIWIFMPGRKSIRCDFLFQSNQRGMGEGAILHSSDFPEYFRALDVFRVVSVVDIEGEQYTQEFRESYFKPLEISCMLDAPIYQDGKVAGIVCHEQVGPMRQWTSMDCDFAAAVAEAIARLYQESARFLAESHLGAIRGRVAGLERMSSLGRAATDIAHDFRNVLGAAGGYAELIQKAGGTNPLLQEYVQGLQEAIEQGIQLTRKLTTFGHPGPARPRVTDLESLLHRYRDMLSTAVGPHVDIRIEIDSAISRVFIDESQLERVLLNLAINARDAMPDGGTITLSLRETTQLSDQAREGDRVVLEVRDTGVGVDEATKARMFEPFFTTKGARGTGLGLAIVNQIMAHAGGTVHVESELGQGTRIQLHLPRIGQPSKKKQGKGPSSGPE